MSFISNPGIHKKIKILVGDGGVRGGGESWLTYLQTPNQGIPRMPAGLA